VVVPSVVTTTAGTQDRRWGTGSLPGVSRLVVDYAWTFPPSGDAEPVVHHVQSEVPSDLDNSTFAGCLVAKVHPAHLPGGIVILPDQTRAWAQVDFVREPFGTQYPAGAGHYVLDNNYGVTLGFHPADVGLTVKVDYQLHTFQTTEDLDAQTAGDTVYPRRLPLMIEDQPIESARTRQDSGGVPFGETRLAVKGVDGQPLFAADLSGAALTTPVHVLAVDLQTGQTYADGLGMSLDDRTLEPPLQDGFQNGLVTYPLEISGAKAPYVGNTLRFFYRTLNRNAIQVQKAPRYYVDSDTAKAYLSGYLPGGQNEATSLAEVDYRTYQLTYVAAPSGNTYRLGVIEFGQWLTGENWSTAESSAGETVAVSYAYVRAPGEREYVWGELHTVPAGGRKFTLNHATLTGEAIEVLAVNGVSARAKAWWLNKTGRQLVLDVETVFLANPLGGVARVQ